MPSRSTPGRSSSPCSRASSRPRAPPPHTDQIARAFGRARVRCSTCPASASSVWSSGASDHITTQYGSHQVSHHTPYPLRAARVRMRRSRPTVRCAACTPRSSRRSAMHRSRRVPSRFARRSPRAASRFGGDAGWPFVVDQVPRLIAAAEWAAVEGGLQRRAAALEAFVADVHGPRHCFADGVVPADVLDGCPFHEPDLDGLADPPSARIRHRGHGSRARRDRRAHGARGQLPHALRAGLRSRGARCRGAALR